MSQPTIEDLEPLSTEMSNLETPLSMPSGKHIKPESVDANKDKFVPIYTDDQLNVINNFYKLKGKYDQEQRRKRQKIINTPGLSKSDKRMAWTRAKPKCVNCRKPVGTFFSVKKRVLRAQCGAAVNPTPGIKPCKLHIEMELADVTTMQHTIDAFDGYKEDDKEDIIKTKLNLLFGFMNEETAISDFEVKRQSFEEDLETYNTYLEQYVDIHNNKENKELLKAEMIKSEEVIQQMKDIMVSRTLSEEEEGEEPQENSPNTLGYIRDLVTIQIHNLERILLKIRKLKYDYYAMEEDEDDPNIHKLVTKPISVYRSEVVIDKSPKVVHFTI